MTIDDLLNAYPDVAHDAAAIGYGLARNDPKFAAMDARQQATTTAWYSVKLLLKTLESSGIITEAGLQEADIRTQLQQARTELIQGEQ